MVVADIESCFFLRCRSFFIFFSDRTRRGVRRRSALNLIDMAFRSFLFFVDFVTYTAVFSRPLSLVRSTQSIDSRLISAIGLSSNARRMSFSLAGLGSLFVFLWPNARFVERFFCKASEFGLSSDVGPSATGSSGCVTLF